jgi:hypothetical protein
MRGAAIARTGFDAGTRCTAGAGAGVARIPPWYRNGTGRGTKSRFLTAQNVTSRRCFSQQNKPMRYGAASLVTGCIVRIEK